MSQAQKLEDSMSATGMERTMRNTVNRQLDRCMKMMATVLGYHENITTDENGNKIITLVTVDHNPAKSISREQFESLIRQLPGNKDLREALWNMAVQRKNINFDDLVA